MLTTDQDEDMSVPGTSRRRMIVGIALGGGLVGAAIVGLVPRSASAAKMKMAPGDIGYQTRPNGAQRCDLCVNWQAPSTCKLVAGSISPAGWCGLFVKKN